MSQSLRILLVDDEAGVRLTFSANLELAGFSVVTAESGEKAIEAAAKQGPFDLVVTDLRMPGMSGADLIRRLRSLLPEVPVILMTAYAHEKLVADLLAEGVFTVLTKPFEVDAVVKIVESAARKPLVLVVDDAALAPELARTLQVHGLRARAVGSAGEALLVLGTHSVDVCVVEADMAGPDGSVLTTKLRAANKAVAVIALSGSGGEAAVARAAGAGAFACLSKPVDAPELVRMIARARGTARPAA